MKSSIDDRKKLISDLKSELKRNSGYKVLEDLFDDGTIEELDPFLKYNGIESGIICAFGKINDRPVYAFAQSIDINGGAVSKSQAYKLDKFYSMVLKSGYPVIGIYNSRGAVLDEGNQILESYAKIAKSCSKLSGVVPQVSIVTGMCFGALSVITSCSDIVILTENAKLGIDVGGEGSDVESAVKSGIADIIAKDEKSALKYARELIYMLPTNNLCGSSSIDFAEGEETEINKNDKYNLIGKIFDDSSFIELKRGFGEHFIIGLASIKGKVIGIVCSNPEGLNYADHNSCSKVAEFVMMCDSYSIPIITVADTKKFLSAKDAAKITCVYSNATTVKIALIVGSVFGSSYMGLCSKEIQDAVFCWSEASISALAPPTAIELLYKDKLHGDGIDFKERRENLINGYIRDETSAMKVCEDGMADDIILPCETREKLNFTLEMLINKRERNLPKKYANIKI